MNKIIIVGVLLLLFVSVPIYKYYKNELKKNQINEDAVPPREYPKDFIGPLRPIDKYIEEDSND